ncbi:G2/M phase-specific E3 ubiquitin-protein ligase-like isoform X1 [Oryzias latipes]|uniref:HECT-type E3 ubiquitin transferase n=1 Tax=Oryzias latipes TaxID=8090 RepID=A0A3B3IHF9_ORYLA|nr:G2/M phase-specific E3 ubiquitin-protein ligase-like isoform X1 [Oryzias latipes]
MLLKLLSYTKFPHLIIQHRVFDTDDSDFESPTFQSRDLETLEQSNVDGPYEPMEADATNREHETEQGGTRFSDFIPLDFEEEEAVEEAIRRSLEEETVQVPQESRSIKTLTTEEITGIVKAHSEMVVTEGFRSIIVSRRNVWTSAIRQFRRPRFVESTDMLYVTFASDENTTEDAEDLGGPRRELFRLLVKAIFQESGAFEESPNGFIPRLNVSHVQNRVYRTIGQMMSTIIVQGGECPALLSSVVLDYLLTGRMFDIRVSPEDVADVELRDSLKTIDQATTDDDLQRAIESCESWRYQIEGLPNPVTMDNKDAFVKNAIIFHVLLQRKSCYDQLAEGLECYELLPLLKENLPLRVLLEMPKVRSDLTADVVATLLKPSYSVLGSNKRPKEELMVVKFRDFLNSVQEREVEECLHGRTLTEAEKTFLRNLNPGHILAFVTGSSRVPAVGFQPSPKLSFVHNENKYLPVAHTCSNELEIFVNSKNLADNDEFEYNFLVALMNGANFSAV